ncbi:MAG: sugar-binding protein [bacterium]
MKKLLTILLLMLSLNLLFAQEQIINSFDVASPDTNYWAYFANHGGKHYQVATNATADKGYINLSHVTDPAPQEGTGSIQMDYSVHNSESYGGYTKLEHWNPDPNAAYDWSMYTHVCFWYNNITAQDLATRVHLRFCLMDVSNSGSLDITDVTQTEYYYSFHYVLDNTPGWNLIEIPLVNNLSWDGQGFNRTGWAGIAGNNELDLDMIKGFSFEFSINGAGEGDASKGVVLLDKLFLSGVAPHPIVMFNGAAVPNNVTCSAWNGSFEVADGAGYDGITPAIKWTHGAGQAWAGIVWDFNDVTKLANYWDTDTLKFWMKAEAGTANLRMQWEDVGTVGKLGANFDPIADDQWHYYEFALKDLTTFYDGTTTFDKDNINLFQILTEGNGTGKTVYIDDLWTGSPFFDVIAPGEPGFVTALGGEFINLITWTDVPGESNEVYDVYYSFNPITDITAPGVDCVAYGVEEGIQLGEHVLMAPINNQELTYYYAVICRDESNNMSDIAPAGSAVTNTAKGTPIIHPAPPANFVADGDMGEWAGLAPINIRPSDGTGTIVNNTVIDGDADCSAQVWLAVDSEYLYAAFDVTDDVVNSTNATSYLRDSPDLFIGLYDWRGPSHTSYKRGEEPDYQIRFNKEGAIVGNLGDDVLGVNEDENYEWFEKFGSGYTIEAKFPWTAIANAATPADDIFSPLVGMKIKLDFSFNDADATGSREGILTYSKDNQDHSWEHVWRWTYTWIGDQMVDVEDNTNNESIPTAFELQQNYPNPFNPATRINFSVASDANVSLKVYNLLGQQVATLVNDYMRPGYYEVNFDASQLASGVYVYQLNAGSFISSKKMLLVK